MRTLPSIAFALPLLCALGCGRSDDTRSAHAGQPAAASSATAEPVAQIVFLDQEEACDCTKKRIDTTWNELQTALGSGNKMQVERVHLDTQKDLAKDYLKAKPVMVPPGIYFMSAKGDLLEMLQGEVTAAQISAALKK
jgi:hypothetical protein